MYLAKAKPESICVTGVKISRHEGCSFLLKKLQKCRPEAYLHSLRVASLCDELARSFALAEADRKRLADSALLHDIGILHAKKGADYGDHCRYGAELLAGRYWESFVDPDLILHHHENLDGTGFFGLKNDQLSLSVRILRAADSYDAMLQPEKGARGMCRTEAFEELFRWSDIHYDEHVVEKLYAIEMNPNGLAGGISDEK